MLISLTNTKPMTYVPSFLGVGHTEVAFALVKAREAFRNQSLTDVALSLARRTESVKEVLIRLLTDFFNLSQDRATKVAPQELLFLSFEHFIVFSMDKIFF